MTSWVRIGLTALMGLVLVHPVNADTLDEMRARATLRWGADQEGGGPYLYPDPQNPAVMRGFEFELADLLARQLGLEAELVQGQWDKLPDLLNRGDLDVVLNGYEWSPIWAERFGTTIPYYIYELQLLARRADRSLVTLDDLRRPGPTGKRRVGVLGGSAAHAYLEEHFGEHVEIVLFDGVTDALRAVELATDGLDATLQDTPVVTFYLDGFPALHPVGEPMGRGYYVILVPSGEAQLLKELNDAIVSALRDGSLRQILERYGLWNPLQQTRSLETDPLGNFKPLPQTRTDESVADSAYEAVRGWHVVWQRAPLLLLAAGTTVKLSMAAMPLAILAGLSLALTRLYGPRTCSRLAVLYVELIRGTPLVLQLYVIFFLLPEMGISIDAFWAGVIGLAINYSAYEAEIYRAGLLAIPRGQMEAALSLGMPRWLALRRIIVPQATRLVIPPVTNDFIALFKDTAVCSLITIVELSKEYYIQARSTGAVLELGMVTALLYLAMSYPLALLTRHLEQRLHREQR